MKKDPSIHEQMLQKDPPYLLLSKVLWADRHLFSPLLSVERWRGLATSHCMTTSARLSCNALGKLDAGGDCNAKAGQTSSIRDDHGFAADLSSDLA